ncbi:hypothetical protein L6452_43809 [Arctium lappa]|uniref:Uncharacterized protein n=1 Tax=Arctium lappa TaxID=4217 RepID=A0ACB8XF34_ARCLA|nr:hypothetical protein L6452_43809 [Arctium lappa]
MCSIPSQVERVGEVAYKLEVLGDLRSIHNTFHVSSLRKCLAEVDMAVPLQDIRVDEKLSFNEESESIVDQKVKRPRTKDISLVKVQWKFHKGREAMWGLESEMKFKYLDLFNKEIPGTESL